VGTWCAIWGTCQT